MNYHKLLLDELRFVVYKKGDTSLTEELLTKAVTVNENLKSLESMEHFKTELIEYLDYYNNRRIKARLKGLPPALHRQQALWAA